MTKLKKKPERDIEKHYTQQQFVAKLRRLADCIEKGKRFQMFFMYVSCTDNTDSQCCQYCQCLKF